MRIRYAVLAAAAAAATAIAPLAASGAQASTANYKTVTISPLHEDTTSVAGTGTQADPQRGPVWAADRLKETLTAVKQANGNWNVTISFGGSTFAGFADPRSAAEGSSNPGGPLLSQGKVTGSIHYNGIVSATAPDPSNVAAHQPPNTGLGAVLSQYFDGQSVSAATTHYLISYTPSLPSQDVTGAGDTWPAGDTYTQAG